MTHFIHHPGLGCEARMTASERVQHALAAGLPDRTIPTPEAPIHAWQSPRVAEFGCTLATITTDATGSTQ